MQVLSQLFRRLFLEYLQKAFDAGQLQFFSSLEPLRQRSEFLRHLDQLRRISWVVYAKPPFAGPEQVLEYVGRYTHRVAISNNRLIDIEEGIVRFRWKDYRDGNQHKVMTVSADEFIRRFLLHVQSQGFHRIRYYGFLSTRHRVQKLARCRELLAMPVSEPSNDDPARDYRDTYEDLTGISLRQCPVCRLGTMVTIESIEGITIPPPILDTS